MKRLFETISSIVSAERKRIRVRVNEFSRSKKITLISIASMLLFSVLMISVIDTLKPTRSELEKLHGASFEESKIVSIIERKYPGKGNYTLFKVEDKNAYFPLLLDLEYYYLKELFKVGTHITKAKFSFEAEIKTGEKAFHVLFRNPKNEDDRLFGSLLSTVFFGVFFTIIFFTPSSLLKTTQRRTNH